MKEKGTYAPRLCFIILAYLDTRKYAGLIFVFKDFEFKSCYPNNSDRARTKAKSFIMGVTGFRSSSIRA